MSAIETQLANVSGRQWLEAIRDGLAPPPPTAQLLDLELAAVESGRTVFRFRPHERFGNGAGAVHGGILSTLADFAVTTAIVTQLPPDVLLVTSNLNITYIRPVACDAEPVECEGRVVHLGRTLAHAEAVVSGPGGTHLRATATCYVRRADPTPGGAVHRSELGRS